MNSENTQAQNAMARGLGRPGHGGNAAAGLFRGRVLNEVEEGVCLDRDGQAEAAEQQRALQYCGHGTRLHVHQHVWNEGKGHAAEQGAEQQVGRAAETKDRIALGDAADHRLQGPEQGINADDEGDQHGGQTQLDDRHPVDAGHDQTESPGDGDFLQGELQLGLIFVDDHPSALCHKLRAQAPRSAARVRVMPLPLTR